MLSLPCSQHRPLSNYSMLTLHAYSYSVSLSLELSLIERLPFSQAQEIPQELHNKIILSAFIISVFYLPKLNETKLKINTVEMIPAAFNKVQIWIIKHLITLAWMEQRYPQPELELVSATQSLSPVILLSLCLMFSEDKGFFPINRFQVTV